MEPEFMTKINELIAKGDWTQADIAFLQARKSYIDPKTFKALNLEAGEDEQDDEQDDGVDLGSLKVADLKILAEEQGIDLGEATKKEDIIAVIEAAVEE